MERRSGGRAESDSQPELLLHLEEAVGQIQNSESFRRWLDISSRFHTYSLSNQLLIAAQRPDATQVAGFNAWLKLGRHVRKGERGIKIVVPLMRKVANEAGEEERRVTGFGTGHVFDVSQTDGEPLPELIVPTLEGEAGAELWEGLSRFAAQEGVSVSVVAPEELPPDAMGYYVPQTKQIVVAAHGQRQRTKTLAHELGHHIARVDDRAENECIAEGIAYVVCARFGIDTGERSFPYVAAWAKDRAVLQGVLATIQSASATLINGVSTAMDARAPAPLPLSRVGDVSPTRTTLASTRILHEPGYAGPQSDDFPDFEFHAPNRGVVLRGAMNQLFRLTLQDLEGFDPRSRPGRSERRFCCPLPSCADKPRDAAHRSLSLAVSTGLWHCHRCGSSGRLAHESGERHPQDHLSARRPESTRSRDEDIAWRRHLRTAIPIAETAGAEYLSRRGISSALAFRSAVRYNAKFFGRPAVLFPVTAATGKLVAIHGRYLDSGTPRMRTAGQKAQGVFATQARLLEADELSVTEGPIDALSLASLGLPALALCGTSWPAWLPEILAGKRVHVAFDADRSGDVAAEQLGALLDASDVRWTRLRPKGAKDWNEALLGENGGLFGQALRSGVF